jgi:hypothetical protein
MREEQLNRYGKKRQKYLTVHGEYAKSIQECTENTRILGLFLLHDTIHEYAKSILSHMERTCKENKRIRRRHQEFLVRIWRIRQST